MAETRWDSLYSEIFKYCWIVVRMPMKILTDPMTIGAIVCIEAGRLPWAKEAVHEIVERIIAGIVNHA